jgi:hypothetical protein
MSARQGLLGLQLGSILYIYRANIVRKFPALSNPSAHAAGLSNFSSPHLTSACRFSHFTE